MHPLLNQYFLFIYYYHHRTLHSFPTRRSSDLRCVWYVRFVSALKLRLTLWGSSVYLSVLCGDIDRKSTRLNSSHVSISYAVFCLKKKNLYIFIFFLYVIIIDYVIMYELFVVMC